MLHGGETIKYLDNSNVLDIVLLESKRIGHGLNLAKHSYLMEEFK